MPQPPIPFGKRKATTRSARLKMTIEGPSKAGKSFCALVVARELVATLKANKCLTGDGTILGICSENGRLEDHYGDCVVDFCCERLPSYEPETYIDFLKQGVDSNASVIIIDGISQEWAGKGGSLEQQHIIQKINPRYNSFTAWSEITPRHNRFIEEIVRAPCHVICTMRTKTDWAMEANDKGKLQPVKIGMKPIQRDETDYEFDVCGNIDMNHILSVTTRGSLSRLIGDRKFLPGPSVDDAGEVIHLGRIIGEWISGKTGLSDGLASRQQIDEIMALGETLEMKNAQWKALFKLVNISSLDSMDMKTYDIIKSDMLYKIKLKAKSKSVDSVEV